MPISSYNYAGGGEHNLAFTGVNAPSSTTVTAESSISQYSFYTISVGDASFTTSSVSSTQTESVTIVSSSYFTTDISETYEGASQASFYGTFWTASADYEGFLSDLESTSSILLSQVTLSMSTFDRATDGDGIDTYTTTAIYVDPLGVQLGYANDVSLKFTKWGRSSSFPGTSFTFSAELFALNSSQFGHDISPYGLITESYHPNIRSQVHYTEWTTASFLINSDNTYAFSGPTLFTTESGTDGTSYFGRYKFSEDSVIYMTTGSDSDGSYRSTSSTLQSLGSSCGSSIEWTNVIGAGGVSSKAFFAGSQVVTVLATRNDYGRTFKVITNYYNGESDYTTHSFEIERSTALQSSRTTEYTVNDDEVLLIAMTDQYVVPISYYSRSISEGFDTITYIPEATVWYF